jgi:hypothetical protein
MELSCRVILKLMDNLYFCGIAQLVQRLAGWSGFDSQQRQNIFLFSTAFIQAVGPTQPAIQYNGNCFLGGKAAEAWNWPHPCSVPSSRMVELYIHTRIRLYGVYLIKYRDNFTFTLYRRTTAHSTQSRFCWTIPVVKRTALFTVWLYIGKGL